VQRQCGAVQRRHRAVRRQRKNDGDGGGCFGTVLEWFWMLYPNLTNLSFWEHKIHGQNTEKNVCKMKDDVFFII